MQHLTPSTEQRSGALNYYVLVQRAFRNHGTQLSLTQKLWKISLFAVSQNESQALSGHKNFCTMVDFLHSNIGGGDGDFSPTWIRESLYTFGNKYICSNCHER